MNPVPKEIRHFYHRAGFGIGIPELYSDFQTPVGQLIDEAVQKKVEAIEPEVQTHGSPVRDKSPFAGYEDPQMHSMDTLSNQLDRLRSRWVHQSIRTEGILPEKMTLFWHGHFACQCATESVANQYLNVLRRNALGNFKNLLHEVVKTPAMIIFLNNLQNRKGHPNENFARELMELFTMGRGNYTEQDVAESARAFTGWSTNQSGTFFFRENNHDYGAKRFLGQQGKFKGEDIVDIILQHSSTPYFLAEKLFRFFVNDQVDPNHVAKIAQRIKELDYDLAGIMHYIFSSDFFYSPANIGNRIKTPMELLVHVARLFGIEYMQPTQLSFLQKALGQLLFDPPNVAGWPGGRNWINNSTLMLRLNLVRYLLRKERFDHAVSTPLEAMAAGESIQVVEIKKDYSPLLERLSGTRYDQMEALLKNLLLATNGRVGDISRSKDFKELNFTFELILKTVSLPEFQMS